MSDFWQLKMRTYFSRIDFDKDGAITRKDFEGMGARFVETGKLSGDQAAALQKNILDVWDQSLGPVGKVEALNEGAFMAVMTTLVGDPTLKESLEAPLPLFFKAVDSNNDGKISQEEYAEFFKILGLNPDLAPTSFQAIDTDKDGQLSLQEFTTAGSDFFYSNDKDAPTKFFWGPLLEK